MMFRRVQPLRVLLYVLLAACQKSGTIEQGGNGDPQGSPPGDSDPGDGSGDDPGYPGDAWLPGDVSPGDPNPGDVLSPGDSGLPISPDEPFVWFPIDFSQAKDLGHVPQLVVPSSGPKTVMFTDTTDAIGLTSAIGGGNTHGVGLALVDVNNDGWEDLFIANGRRNNSQVFFDSMLFTNEGDGTFSDASVTANVSGANGILNGRDAFSVAAADYDNDGDVDLYIGTHPNDVLMQNNGAGIFSDVTVARGAGGPASDGNAVGSGSSKIVSFGDVNNDGWLDIVSATSTLADPGAYLLLNDGTGNFSDVTDGSNVAIHPNGNPCAVLWSDYDNDADVDLWIWNDRGGRVLLRNDFDPQTPSTISFQDVSAAAQISGLDVGNPMGIDGVDIDRDGYSDYYVSDIGGNPLLRNNGDGTFTDITSAAGTGGEFGWGLGFEDFNADGWWDIFVAQEDTEQFFLAFENNGQLPPSFTRRNISYPGVIDGGDSHNVAVAFADLDRDGRTDVVTATTDGSRINAYRNDSDIGTASWLEVRVSQAPGTGERGGIGARVIVRTGDTILFRDVTGGSSRASQNAHSARFGLGQWSGANWVAVLWPDGRQISVLGVAGKQRLDLPLP